MFRAPARDDSATSSKTYHNVNFMDYQCQSRMDWHCQSSFCVRVFSGFGGPALFPPGECLDFMHVCRVFLGTRELRLLEEGRDFMCALRTLVGGSRRADGSMEGWVMLDSARACDPFLKRGREFVFTNAWVQHTLEGFTQTQFGRWSGGGKTRVSRLRKTQESGKRDLRNLCFV